MALAGLLWPALPARAERTQGNFVLIREETRITEDLYVAADRLKIDGTIDGDLVAAVFDEVTIAGEVSGSVTVIASRVVVSGRVGGSLRAIAREVVIEGRVAGDVVTAAWHQTNEPDAQIGRDVMVWAQRADLGGRVGRNIEGTQRSAHLSAVVDGNVDITVSALEVGETAQVRGDLAYTSETVATVRGGAEIDGNLIHRRPLPPNVRIRAFRLLAGVMASIGVMLVGLIVAYLAPERVSRAGSTLQKRPAASFGWGALAVGVPFILAVAGAVTFELSPPGAGLPLLAVFGPLVIAVGSLVLVGLALGPVPIAVALGRRLIPGRSMYAALVTGILVVVAVAWLPWIGRIAAMIAATAGLGAWLVGSEGTSDREELVDHE